MGMDPATLTAVATAVGAAGSVVTGIMNAPKKQSAGEPIKPPVEAKAPVADVFKEKNQGAARGGPSSTLLTALGGVPNTSLNLGRNTLLGA